MEVAEPLYRVKLWIKFICIIQIIAGVLTLASGLFLFSKGLLVSALIVLAEGGAIIFIPTKLYSAIRFIEAAYENDCKEDVLDFSDALSSYFKAMGIYSFISLAPFIAAIVNTPPA